MQKYCIKKKEKALRTHTDLCVQRKEWPLRGCAGKSHWLAPPLKPCRHLPALTTPLFPSEEAGAKAEGFPIPRHLFQPLKKNRLYLQSRNRRADIEKRLVDTVGGEGETNWKSNTDIYTLHVYNRQLEGTCCIAQVQGSQPGAPGWPRWASQAALVVKNSPANAGDVRDAGSIPRSERSPGEGHGNPLQGSCLENPMHREAWWTVSP